MPSYAEIFVHLPEFRNHIARRAQSRELYSPSDRAALSSVLRGAYTAYPSPEANIHATGIGIRQREGKYVPGELVLKLFVFDKPRRDEVRILQMDNFNQIQVDVEVLPVQQILPVAHAAALAPFPVLDQVQSRQRPIVGGISTSPLNAAFVGTLGCFLIRKDTNVQTLFALSNNHVFADVDTLPKGTLIVQPGPETARTDPSDGFAQLELAVPIHFPGPNNPVTNRFDAAIARITDSRLISLGEIHGIKYDPSKVLSPVPDMKVTKCGRTTGITKGTITATNMSPVQVNYGSLSSPKIAVYEDVFNIVGDNQQPFSSPGDSGSIIVDQDTGHPVGLLFAGDDSGTVACDLGALCRQLGAWPI